MTTIVKCLRGLPGSGKSTYAQRLVELGWVRVNRDDLRNSMFGKYWGLTHEQEGLISKFERALAEQALQAGYDVVIDATHLRNKYLREWNKFALKHGALFDVHDIDTPVDVCVERDSARDRHVGEDVIRDMAARFLKKGRFLPYTPLEPEAVPVEEPYVNPAHLMHVVIVDIDGTMALMGDRDPYDESTVSQDKPNWPVIRLVNDLLLRGVCVAFVSGRTDACRYDTLRWLRRYLPEKSSNWFLEMRKAGDNRRDDIVKREIFDRVFRNKYHVKFVLDDRNQVVRMWRALGLPVFQVAVGEF
jgi:predicted kinase